MVPWKCAGLVLKSGHEGVGPLVQRVAERLQAHGLELMAGPHAAPALSRTSASDMEALAARADVVVVLGGDGTVLATARALGKRPVPILGINLGQLGYLTEVARDDAESDLDHILGGDFELHERSRLEVVTYEGEREVDSGLVLNDAVFSQGPDVARLIELETSVDGRDLSRYRADGLIVSTPTGSTAYNLSAGGPILAPDVPATIVTPICPHTLSLRPIVLADTSTIEVHVSDDAPARLTLDGQVGRILRQHERVRITRAPHSVRFVSLPGRDHFATMRTKLGWGGR